MSELRLARSARELRDELEDLIRDDLIGPVGGPEEELEDAPVDRYLLGLLAPRFTFQLSGSDGPSRAAAEENGEDPIEADLLPEDGLADGGLMAEGEDGTAEDRPPAVDQLVPSSFGMTFALDGESGELGVTASWGAYGKQTSEERLDRDGKPMRVWGRRQCGGEVRIAVRGSGSLGRFTPDRDEPEVVIRGLARRRNDHVLVSLGEPDQLGPLLRHALDRAQLCSSDPLCSEHDPQLDSSVHRAACHACQLASETSCERGNRFLDRATLVRTLADRERGTNFAYFQAAT